MEFSRPFCRLKIGQSGAGRLEIRPLEIRLRPLFVGRIETAPRFFAILDGRDAAVRFVERIALCSESQGTE